VSGVAERRPERNPRADLERKLREAEERADNAAHAIVRELHGKSIYADSIQRERSRLEQALVEAAGWKRCLKALAELEHAEERRG
jgi:hypothetical protein